MAGDTRKSDVIVEAFLVDAESLTRLTALMGPGDSAKFKLTYGDGSSQDFDTLEEVLAQPNYDNRPITGIDISQKNYSSPYLTFELADRRWSPLRYYVSGEERDVLYLSRKAEDALQSMRQWYSRIARAEPVAILGIIVTVALVVVLILGAVVLLTDDGSPRPIDARDYLAGYVWGYAGYAVFIGLLFALGRFRKWLFPIAVFAWGDGARRQTRYESRRRFFGITVLAGLGIGVARELILRLFWR